MNRYTAGRLKAAYVLGMTPKTFEHVTDLAGLGLLAAYPAYHLYQNVKDDKPLGENAAELAGLGILAASPAIAMARRGR